MYRDRRKLKQSFDRAFNTDGRRKNTLHRQYFIIAQPLKSLYLLYHSTTLTCLSLSVSLSISLPWKCFIHPKASRYSTAQHNTTKETRHHVCYSASQSYICTCVNVKCPERLVAERISRCIVLPHLCGHVSRGSVGAERDVTRGRQIHTYHLLVCWSAHLLYNSD